MSLRLARMYGAYRMCVIFLYIMNVYEVAEVVVRLVINKKEAVT